MSNLHSVLFASGLLAIDQQTGRSRSWQGRILLCTLRTEPVRAAFPHTAPPEVFDGKPELDGLPYADPAPVTRDPDAVFGMCFASPDGCTMSSGARPCEL